MTLGKWLVTGEDTHRNWKYYLDAGTEIVYMRKDQEYECLECINSHYVYNGKRTSVLPPSSIPVDLDLSGSKISLLPYKFAAWEQENGNQHLFKNILKLWQNGNNKYYP